MSNTIETKTIDEILRARARTQLKQDISNAKSHLSPFFTMHRTITFTVKETTVEVTAWDVLSALENSAFSANVQEREQQEIRNFLASVDNFKRQLDGLEVLDYE